MPVTVRDMATGDLDAVLRLQTTTAEAPQWRRSVYEHLLAQSSQEKLLLIAECDGEFSGFVAGERIAGEIELQSIVVDAAVRRLGVGKALLAAFVEKARLAKASRVLLEVRSKNGSAISFYMHAGFKQDGFRRGYYSDPNDDALLMSLDLGTPPNL